LINVHTQVTEPLLQEGFAGTGPVEGCKLFRKEKVYFCICMRLCLNIDLKYYGFVTQWMIFIHYFDRISAALAILTLNGRHL
jgi:nucleolysin TIA-1/TIAR